MHYEAPKKKKQGDNGWDEAFDALDALANKLESDSEENDTNNKEREVEDGERDGEDGEVEEGTFNGQEGMTAEEEWDLEKTVKPVQRVLVFFFFFFYIRFYCARSNFSYLCYTFTVNFCN